MKLKITAAALAGIILVVIVYAFYFNKTSHNNSIEQKKIGEVKKSEIGNVVDVDYVAENPEKYKGSIGISGKVVQTDDSKNLFILGCEDACVSMPVKYKGKMPLKDHDVIAYGEIKLMDNGKYIFEASDYSEK